MLEILIAAVPLLLLLASLLAGFYPGCDAVVRLAERLAAPPGRRAAALRVRAPRRPERCAAHGGLLMGFSLSGRAPPAAA